MTSPTTWVTGAGGFTGRHLLARLRGQGRSPIALTRRPAPGAEVCHLDDPAAIRDLLDRTRPAAIYHCAGSFTNEWTHDVPANVTASGNLLLAVADADWPVRVLLIGSAAEYGHPPSGPVPETAPSRPVSVYGVTKAMQTQLMEFFHRQQGVDVVMARTFNLLGDGISPRLFPGHVASQIAALKAGKTDRIRVGNLDSRRDYIPVDDAVAHYERILAHGRAGEAYNVGRGHSVRMRDLLAEMLAAAELDFQVVESRDPRTAAADPGDIYADLAKLNQLPIDR